jgi:AhpD family alkylhydroperoxidase
MAMRGDSDWTVGERELMAAMTAKWNACEFCVGAHGAIAARVLGRPVVDAALQDVQLAELPARLRATLAFLEVLTRTPDTLTAEDALTVLRRESPRGPGGCDRGSRAVQRHRPLRGCPRLRGTSRQGPRSRPPRNVGQVIDRVDHLAEVRLL